MIRRLFIKQNNYTNDQASQTNQARRSSVFGLFLILSLISFLILGIFNETVSAYWSSETHYLSNALQADISIGRWIEEGLIDGDSKIVVWDPENPPTETLKAGDIIVYPTDDGGHIYYVALKPVKPNDPDFDPGEPNDKWIKRMSYSEDTKEYRSFHRYEQGDYVIDNGILYKWRIVNPHKPNWFSEERPDPDNNYYWRKAEAPPEGTIYDYWFRYKIYYRDEVVYWEGYWYKSLSSGKSDREPRANSAYWERLPGKPSMQRSLSSPQAFGMKRSTLSPEELQVKIEGLQEALVEAGERELTAFNLAAESMKLQLSQGFITELDALSTEEQNLLLTQSGINTLNMTEAAEGEPGALNVEEPELFASDSEVANAENVNLEAASELSDEEKQIRREELLAELQEKREALTRGSMESALQDTELEALVKARLLVEDELERTIEEKKTIELLALSENSMEEELSEFTTVEKLSEYAGGEEIKTNLDPEIEEILGEFALEDNLAQMDEESELEQDSEYIKEMLDARLEIIRERMAEIAEEHLEQVYSAYLADFAKMQAEMMSEAAIGSEENLISETSATEAEPSVGEVQEMPTEVESSVEIPTVPSEIPSGEVPEETLSPQETPGETAVDPSINEDPGEQGMSETQEASSEHNGVIESSEDPSLLPSLDEAAEDLVASPSESEVRNEEMPLPEEPDSSGELTEAPSDLVEENASESSLEPTDDIVEESPEPSPGV